MTALEFRRYAVVAAPLVSAVLIVAAYFLDPAIDEEGREMARGWPDRRRAACPSPRRGGPRTRGAVSPA